MICKKITALILSFAFLVCGTSVCAYAQTDNTVTVTNETRSVVLDISTVQYAGTVVAVSVWNPGYTSENIEDVYAKKIKLSDINAYTGEVIVDSDKRIKETFTLHKDAPSGIYTLELHIPGSTEPEVYSFNFRNVARVQTTLDVIKSGDCDQTKLIFETGILDIDVENGTKYLSYDEEVKGYITKNIVDKAPQDEPTFQQALVNEINKIEVVKELVSLKGSRKELKEYTETNYSLLLLDTSDDNCWASYQTMNDTQKEQLYLNFSANISSCIYPEDVKTAFKTAAESVKPSTNTIIPVIKPSGGGGGGGGGKSSSNISVSSDAVVSNNQPLEAPVLRFEDTSGHWARGVIEYLAVKGIINGKSETEFAPDNYITREEFVKLLVSALNLKSASVEAVVFNDVDDSEWYYSYIALAQVLDVVNGISQDTFGIGMNITRQDMATMILKGITKIDKMLGEDVAEFADDEQVASYAKTAVSKLGGAGIIKGYSDNTFRPEAPATRAEAVQMIYNIMNSFELF